MVADDMSSSVTKKVDEGPPLPIETELEVISLVPSTEDPLDVLVDTALDVTGALIHVGISTTIKTLLLV